MCFIHKLKHCWYMQVKYLVLKIPLCECPHMHVHKYTLIYAMYSYIRTCFTPVLLYAYTMHESVTAVQTLPLLQNVNQGN